MISDYKYDMQMRAEEIAEEEGTEFYALSSDKQDVIFNKAKEWWIDVQLCRADNEE